MRERCDEFAGDPPNPDTGLPAQTFRVHDLEVPAVIFRKKDSASTSAHDALGDYIESSDLAGMNEEYMAIRRAVMSLPAWSAPWPIWVQAPEYWGQFIMQFDEFFADVNLTMGGEMYVFSEDAFWQLS